MRGESHAYYLAYVDFNLKTFGFLTHGVKTSFNSSNSDPLW